MKIHDIFGPGSNREERILYDYNVLHEKVEACKKLGLHIVLTSGTYDMKHIGHERYLERAREQGDLLIVGVDNDKKTSKRKGPHRPINHEDERTEALCHTRHVDLVFLKQETDEHWQLIRTVQPDVLVLTAGSGYSSDDLKALEKYCKKIMVLEPQATTSTTAKIRKALLAPADEIKNRLREAVNEVCGYVDKVTGNNGENNE